MNTKHIFLTGEKQVGKSTAIKIFLDRSGVTADGFITYWEPMGEAGGGLYLSPFFTGAPSEEKYLIAKKGEQKNGPQEKMLRVFNVHGCGILDNSGKRDIIIMDELGFIESQAADFRQSVMRRLAGDVPVLGVIKPMQTEFLDAIRALANVEVQEVTEENRDAIPEWLLERAFK